ncbi:type I restriction endonuclease subunit S [Salmonella enterica]|nr:type I restriction endonuclease subunit S [Salmonella enterica]EBY6652858.1 type I restriction endonuclease subunit S [Salmonella enterica subsp. enterica serovar Oranienburg]ECC3822456.1 type I restriction endonuclease subunit S [Salmonella enterica]
MSGGKLPEGWVNSKFTDLMDVQGGTQPPKSEFIPEAQNGYIRLLQIRDFGKKPVPTYIPETKKLKTCHEEDLLIGRYGASLGRICTGHAGAYNVALAKVIYPHEFERSFIRYYLESEIFQFPLRLLSRSAQNGFNKEDLSRFDFLLAPLAEQKVIAEKLDTLLAQVDSTKARLEQIPQILKRFRQAVLVSAVNGKLQAESSSKECCTIDSLCLTSFDGPFGSKLKTSDYTNSGIRVVRLENIGHLEFNSEKETYISHEKYKSLYNNTLKENDLIFSSFVDEDVRVCLIPQSEQTFINKADCFCLRLNPSLASPHYLALVLASKTSYEQIKEKVQGITRPRINLRTLRSLKFDIPDLKEQHEIVRRVEQLFAWADTIEKQVNNALNRVNSLTQSILAKAFRGELTAQWRAENPDLISGENSAAALLEKIKAERAASGGKKTSRKKA